MLTKIVISMAVFGSLALAQDLSDADTNLAAGFIRPMTTAGLERTIPAATRSDADRTLRRGRTLWLASIAGLAAANIADAATSWGKFEGNGTLAGGQGRFGGRGVVIKTGVNSLGLIAQVIALRKKPAHRTLAIVNFAAASIFAAMAYRNCGIPSPGSFR